MQPTWLVSDQLPNIQPTSLVRPGLYRSLVSKYHLLTDSLANADTRPKQKVYGNHSHHVHQTALRVRRKGSNVIIDMFKCAFSHSLCPLGPAYDLTSTEVRDNSLVVEWQRPMYTGSSPITGYQVEYAKKGTSEWIIANETAVSHRFLKVRAFLMWFIVPVCLFVWL